MGNDVSFMQYMRAHGNMPGPTQRPYMTGAIGGLLAEIPAAALLFWSGALESASRFFSINLWLTISLDAALMILAGTIYAAIFKRAANDRRGGWLFGAAYGFLLWMLTPFTLWQLITSRPIVVGTAAMGVFGARIVYGLILGLLYPHIHARLQKKLKSSPQD